MGLSPPVGHTALTGGKDGERETGGRSGENCGCTARAMEVGKDGEKGGVRVGSCSPAVAV